MQRARSLQLRGRSISQSATRAQFHQDQTHFFVVHEAQIAIYETTKLKCLKHISPLPDYSWLLNAVGSQKLIHYIYFYSGFRTNLNFSCDSQLIHASFLVIKIFCNPLLKTKNVIFLIVRFSWPRIVKSVSEQHPVLKFELQLITGRGRKPSNLAIGKKISINAWLCLNITYI